ncbi:unnamed protein product [Toxocara canis]|uniref:ZP domain-containing protein n=1 Tax=Toxocara canis TaxID=6265 RepID=A0A183U9J5_TOXCA|nr:unnamed protein product [Toxocara canis]
MNKSTWQLIGRPALQPSSLIAHSASGDQIKILGQRACNYSFQNASAQGIFYVANTHCNLLGAERFSNMGIYAVMDALPCDDSDRPTALNIGSITPTNTSVAKDPQRRSAYSPANQITPHEPPGTI